VNDPAVRSTMEALFADVAPGKLAHAVALDSPYATPGHINGDGTVAYATITFDEQAGDLPASTAQPLIDGAKARQSQDVTIELSGPVVARALEPPMGATEGFGRTRRALRTPVRPPRPTTWTGFCFGDARRVVVRLCGVGAVVSTEAVGGRPVVATGPAASVGPGAPALLAPIKPPKMAPRTKPMASTGAVRLRRGTVGGCGAGASAACGAGAGGAIGGAGTGVVERRGSNTSGGSGRAFRPSSASAGSTKASSGLIGPRSSAVESRSPPPSVDVTQTVGIVSVSTRMTSSLASDSGSASPMFSHFAA